MNALEITAQQQNTWSVTANRLKAGLDRTRWITFGLSIAGALLATLAGQFDGNPRWWCAMGGAAVLATGTFLTTRLMGQSNLASWARARAAAEALKREAYKCAARAAPYDGDDASRMALLNDEREKIEDTVFDLLGKVVRPRKAGSTPTADITPAEYLERRVSNQAAGFYEPKAETNRRVAASLGWVEFVLALAATIITALIGAADKKALSESFDFVALTAVLTTIAGAVVAHVEAARYDFLVTTYRATARRLRSELARAGQFTAPSPEWSAFVNRCETILADENSGWLAKWTK
jgi:hypothetical protein